ncbi:hypothetical protein [Pseudanabaena sp. FACHB-2040]|uniref:NACHT domain-containing protein n=1 Tax=Pseudanabaena sp. FACHB-2040 TaxID=2692859 RepID=UPI001683B511|nr:hypothetical protein [Pseudanabaena sp. FACHB-2040]MBD2257640.1 hypothetical protein [Pseudanabaena sp. FACHB-2040]
MATPSLLDLTPLRPPSAYDRALLITAVNQQIAWQQQTALHVLQQAKAKRRTTVAVGSGRQSTAQATAVKSVPSLVTLQYQIWSLQMGKQATQKLSSPSEVVKLFQRDGMDGRLLILGEPGSGKTQTLLTLASDLLKKSRTSTAPVPVLLDLSSWRGEPISSWAVAKLWELYRVPDNCARAWLINAQLTLMLDGFDNLEVSQQRTCAAEIDAFLRGNVDQTLALCCQRQVMERSGIPFDQFNGGVHLMPLGAQQVKDYATGLDQADLWKGIKASKVLQPLARSPFLLNCLAEFFEGQPVANQGDLLQRFITHQITIGGAPKKPFSPRDRHRYLTWLANHLEKRDRTFYIESLDSSALLDSQRWLYRLLVGLILGLLTGVFVHPMFGLAVGLMASQVDLEAYPKYKLSIASLSWGSGLSLLLRAFIPGLLLALVLGGLAGLVGGRFGQGGTGFTLGGLIGLGLGLIFGCLFELRSGLQSSIQVRRRPNQDIFNAVRNLFIVLALLGVLVQVGLTLLNLSSGLAVRDLVNTDLLQGLLATGLAFGLWASYSIQHFVIRALLSASGSTPWNYAHFLNFAASQRLLQKVGGGYRFVHEQVREQFTKGEMRGMGNPEMQR